MQRTTIDKECDSGYMLWGRSITQMEADIAYFDARLALLGTPETPYQEAQRKVCSQLQGRLIESLLYLRERAMRQGDRRSIAES